MKAAPVVIAMTALAAVSMLSVGCAQTATVHASPVWSATVPEYGVECSKTTNVFPFYSKNVTIYADRIEESGSVLLFISWTNVTRRGADNEPVDVEPVAADAQKSATEEEKVESPETGAQALEGADSEAPEEEVDIPEQAEPAGTAEGETAEEAEVPDESEVQAPSDDNIQELESGSEESE
ncbi:MAG: hypothetical protein J7M19_03415 [Planctomycetes bacterium]|nr:hypothetical protein [Planctomycetota bacterium]